MALISKLTDIADAVRTRTAKTGKLTLADMPALILNADEPPVIDYDALPVTVDERTSAGAYETTDAVRLYLPNMSSIPKLAYVGCPNLVMVDAPACTSMGLYNFAYCPRLRHVELPALESITGTASTLDVPPLSRSPITSLSLPACTTVGQYGLARLIQLRTIDLPACTSIGYGAFVGCSSLTEVNLPALTSIATYGFANCAQLRVLDLPACTSIGDKGIKNNYIFETLVLRASQVCTLGTDIFTNTSLTNVYVPDDLVDEYKAATNWTAHANKIKPLSEYEG